MAIKTIEVFRKIRDEHYRILKDKPVNEQIAFYQQQAKFVRTRAGRLLKKQSSHSV